METKFYAEAKNNNWSVAEVTKENRKMLVQGP